MCRIILNESMAKPIRGTPVLRGEDANMFLKTMFKKQKARITRKEIKLAESIKQFAQLLK